MKRPPDEYMINHFSKVRINFFRTKQKEIIDSIDCSDFKFATFNKVNLFAHGQDEDKAFKNLSFWDA